MCIKYFLMPLTLTLQLMKEMKYFFLFRHLFDHSKCEATMKIDSILPCLDLQIHCQNKQKRDIQNNFFLFQGLIILSSKFVLIENNNFFCSSPEKSSSEVSPSTCVSDSVRQEVETRCHRHSHCHLSAAPDQLGAPHCRGE